MGNFSKLWGSIVGSLAGAIAGIVIGTLTGAGIGECSDPSQVASCSVFGFTTAQLSTALTMAGAWLGTYLFPPNQP